MYSEKVVTTKHVAKEPLFFFREYTFFLTVFMVHYIIKQGHLVCTSQHKPVMPKETTMCPNSELAIVTIKPEITTVKA